MVAITGRLPKREWLGKLLVLALLNFAIFWSLLFVAAYRLPGSIAATLSALQPLAVIVLSTLILRERAPRLAVAAGCTGVAGVALLVLARDVSLDAIGVFAALGSAGAAASGMVYFKKWRMPATVVDMTSWQLVLAGFLLTPTALVAEGVPQSISSTNLAGFIWIGLVGTVCAYLVWFRGITRLGPGVVSLMGMVSPVAAAILAWMYFGQGLSLNEILGITIIFLSLWAGQSAWRRKLLS
ncbi:MAG: DMT family transporter [Mesorhizobium sp.]|nr:DMT family transporter [Mesorhizobium sp.]